MSSNILRDIATYLEGKGVGTIGTNLFVGCFPTSAATGISINEPGPEIPYFIGVGAYNSVAKTVQFLVKGATYETARQNARNAVNVFLGKAGLDLTGWLICSVTGTLPQYLGLDDKQYHVFSSNLIFYSKEK